MRRRRVCLVVPHLSTVLLGQNPSMTVLVFISNVLLVPSPRRDVLPTTPTDTSTIISCVSGASTEVLFHLKKRLLTT